MHEAYQAETEASMLETEALVGLEAACKTEAPRPRPHPCIKLKHRYINVCSMRSSNYEIITSIPFRLIIYVVHMTSFMHWC